MSRFVSYAQNREDVLLWRVLGHVPHGFYVDVGANHPSDDSVTRAFYDRGWHGINIEPIALHHAQLRACRLRDVNLRLAVGAQDGELALFDTPIRGRATANSTVADDLRHQGLEITSQRVPVQRLSKVFEAYAPPVVHFLKIDVEGFESEVLKGMDFVRFRPWVVVVEATRPGTRDLDLSWQPLLLDAGYTQVFFDGLNAYFLADEKPDLQAAFDAPVNVFDAYTTAETEGHALAEQNLQQRNAALLSQIQALEANLERNVQDVRSAQAAHDQALLRLQQVYASTSWRLTGPLRRVLRVGFALWRTLRPKAAAPLPRLGGAAPSPMVAAPSLGQSPPAMRCDAAAMPLYARALSLPQPPLAPTPLHFRLVGHMGGHYSLAIVNRGLALALEAAQPGRISLQPVHGEVQPDLGDLSGLPPQQAQVLQAIWARQNQAAPVMDGCVVSISHHYPLYADPQPADLRLTLFFWEETQVAAAMLAQLAAQSDALLVASTFVRKALRDSGCDLPIFVLAMGVEAGAPAAEPPPAAMGAGVLRFLHVSSAFERKGVDVLLRAYLQAFSADDAVELVIKTFPNPHNQVHAWLDAARAQCSRPARVVIDERSLDAAEMDALYRSAHAVVLPTRGEGFNLPAAEAMARAIPVVTTGFGAQTDFCTRRTAWLLPWQFAPSASHVRSSHSCWVEPDVQATAQTLRDLETQLRCGSASVTSRALRGAQWVRAQAQWGWAAQQISGWAAALLAEKRLGGWDDNYVLSALTPWATACGIAQYSKCLLAPWAQAGRLRVYCDQRTHDVAPNDCYEVAWQLGDADSVCAALARIAQQAPEVLWVQHQPSLFDLSDAVCLALADLAQAGSVVVLELHATRALLQARRLGAAALSALRRIDRLVVHQVDDLNQLLALGLADNVMLLPLGTPQPQPAQTGLDRAALGIPSDALVLGSFGFLLPHKGVDQLIESLLLLQAQLGRSVHLLAVNAALDARSLATAQQCQALAQRLNLTPLVHWVSDYRSIEESIQLLGLADCLVFAYQNTAESASGAVTVGLAALKPVLVSDAPIFADVQDCVWRMASADAQAICHTVVQVLAHPQAAQDKVALQRDWLAQRDWPQIAHRVDGVIKGLLRDHAWIARMQFEASPPQAPAPEPAICAPQWLVDVSELMLRDAATGIQRVVRQVVQTWLKAPPAGFQVRLVGARAGETYRYVGQIGDWFADAQVQAGADVAVDAGDVFVGLDLAAHLFPFATGQLAAWRRLGVRVTFVVYDLIPLLHPQWTVPGMAAAFGEWMRGLGQESDRLVAISNAVATDVRSWLADQAAAGRVPSVGAFRLGSDLADGHVAPSRDLSAEEIAFLTHCKATPTLLSVGTVEPRKGYAQTIEALDLLWNRGVAVQWVLVGKPGWMVDELVQRLRNHAQAGRQLHWFESADDAWLDALYGHCSGLLAASFAEGFGLPLVEAARRGLPLLARDLAVFREVAGAHAFYFKADDAPALAAALTQWLGLARAGLLPRVTDWVSLSWSESARQLATAVLSDTCEAVC